MKYRVIIVLKNGEFGGFLTHRNRDSWTFKTATRYAEEFVSRHGGHATVTPE